jgi:hypothetical protein
MIGIFDDGLSKAVKLVVGDVKLNEKRPTDLHHMHDSRFSFYRLPMDELCWSF